ncbi:DoxX family protein [Shinella sp. BYT-45]|uniref:DoxX family protein n=1 Tax=Shinella sp. BYT-45 TaxID=3377377 RepID=UPI00397F0970
MNILLWVLQVLLALHTAVGAAWKLFNSEQAVPSLKAIPHGIWLGMSAVEVLCALGLVLAGFHRPLAFLVPFAAIVVAAEMLLFCGVHIASGDRSYGPMVYWLVVVAICAFIAYGRLVLKPL